MSQTIAIFNPDHDLALAHGWTHYVSPDSARVFARDAAAVMGWFCPQIPALVAQDIPADFQQLCQNFAMPPSFVPISKVVPKDIDDVVAWGWNYNLRERLQKLGIVSGLPTDDELVHIQRLSHRRTAIRAMEFLRSHVATPDLLPMAATELNDLSAVECWVRQQADVICKMPWSGSGRGLRRIVGSMSPHQQGWVGQVIRKYGSILCEIFYPVVQDFAMEFFCDGVPHFCGYSLFSTHNGVYQSNKLLTDANIENILRQWLPRELLLEYRELLLQFLQAEICPFYRGCVGIDMFVYQKDGRTLLNPMVEINFRMTMGYLSTIFTKNYLYENVSGRLSIRYSPHREALMYENQDLKEKFPPKFCDGKLVSGCFSLTPIAANTHYAIRVMADN